MSAVGLSGGTSAPSGDRGGAPRAGVGATSP